MRRQAVGPSSARGCGGRELELAGDLEPAGAVGGLADRGGGAGGGRLGARRSVHAGDVAQALGQLGEQGRNLDSSAALVAALALASAVLAVPALDPGARAGRRPGAADLLGRTFDSTCSSGH